MPLKIYQSICSLCEKQLFACSEKEIAERASMHDQNHKSEKNYEIAEFDGCKFLDTATYSLTSMYQSTNSYESSFKSICFLRMTDQNAARNKLITIYFNISEDSEFLCLVLILMLHGFDCSNENHILSRHFSKKEQITLFGYSVCQIRSMDKFKIKIQKEGNDVDVSFDNSCVLKPIRNNDGQFIGDYEFTKK